MVKIKIFINLSLLLLIVHLFYLSGGKFSKLLFNSKKFWVIDFEILIFLFF